MASSPTKEPRSATMNKRAHSPETISSPPPQFFYGKNSCLSNFYPSKFHDPISGNHFFCSEQYFMYAKAELFGDDKMARQILSVEEGHPLQCKKLGRRVSNFDQEVWTARSRDAMERGCYLKFSQNRSMADELLLTGDAEIVEASPRDRIWGIGFNATQALMVSREEWGQNWLGLVLMRVRDTIREERENAKKEYIGDIKKACIRDKKI